MINIFYHYLCLQKTSMMFIAMQIRKFLYSALIPYFFIPTLCSWLIHFQTKLFSKWWWWPAGNKLFHSENHRLIKPPSYICQIVDKSLIVFMESNRSVFPSLDEKKNASLSHSRFTVGMQVAIWKTRCASFRNENELLMSSRYLWKSK